MNKLSITILLLFFLSISLTFAQTETCIYKAYQHEIKSTHLNEVRTYWVSLPMNYDSTKMYPVMYVFDAEWRFDLVRNMAYDMAGNRKIPHHIIVGIPHVDWKYKRGVDLTFSHTTNEYNGEKVDSTVYNKTNSGGAQKFYQYLDEELMPAVDQQYSTSGENILVGHSYGGYFNSYILSMDHQFRSFQIYDPSMWYSDGEAIAKIEKELSENKNLNVFITYQPRPKFHESKIKELIELLSDYENINVGFKEYKEETHNSLFMISFIDGMKDLYLDWDKK